MDAIDTIDAAWRAQDGQFVPTPARTHSNHAAFIGLADRLAAERWKG